MKSFAVKKSKWLRGEGGVNSYLLRPKDGKMCCLGFASLAFGYSEKDIFDKRRPLSMDDRSKYHDSFFGEFGNSLLCDIMKINDDQTSDKEKIEELTKKFSDLGIEVKFED